MSPGLMWDGRRMTLGRDREARWVWRVTWCVGGQCLWPTHPTSDGSDFYAIESGGERSM